MDIDSECIVKTKELSIGYETDEGILWAVKEVSFEVPKHLFLYCWREWFWKDDSR